MFLCGESWDTQLANCAYFYINQTKAEGALELPQLDKTLEDVRDTWALPGINFLGNFISETICHPIYYYWKECIFVFGGHGWPQPFSHCLHPLLYCECKRTSGAQVIIHSLFVFSVTILWQYKQFGQFYNCWIFCKFGLIVSCSRCKKAHKNGEG